MSTDTPTAIHGPDAFQKAQRMARYGHRDWLVWSDADGAHAAPRTAENIKRVLLTTGTKRRWTLICADGTPMKGFWWLGINILRQSKRGVA